VVFRRPLPLEAPPSFLWCSNASPLLVEISLSVRVELARSHWFNCDGPAETNLDGLRPFLLVGIDFSCHDALKRKPYLAVIIILSRTLDLRGGACIVDENQRWLQPEPLNGMPAVITEVG
jgi:hypothetical protein